VGGYQKNVGKFDIHKTLDMYQKMMPVGLNRVIVRARTFHANLWSGNIAVSDTTTTIEPKERNCERR